MVEDDERASADDDGDLEGRHSPRELLPEVIRAKGPRVDQKELPKGSLYNCYIFFDSYRSLCNRFSSYSYYSCCSYSSGYSYHRLS